MENETHKLLWDFEIQMHHLISTRRPDLLTVKKKYESLPNSRIYHPSRPQSKIDRKRKQRKVPRSCQRTEKPTWHKEVPVIPVATGAFVAVTKGLEKGLEDLEIRV